MKIDGIDPLLLNRIKEQTDRMVIQKTETAVSDNQVKRESGNPQRKPADIPEQYYDAKLEVALKELNEKAEKDELPLRFDVNRELNLWHVRVYDTTRNEVVREIPTDRALSVLSRLQSLFGVMLDEKR